jgi:hypothetical protein
MSDFLPKRTVIVFTGTSDKDFYAYLIDQLACRGCEARFLHQAPMVMRSLNNPSVAGIIVDALDAHAQADVEKLLAMLRDCHPKPTAVVLLGTETPEELIRSLENYDVWVHPFNESMEGCLDHVAFGTHEQHMHA